MKAQAKVQDTLDITVDRHSMWEAPAQSERDELPKHIYDLRCALAKHLTRFDGRPDSEFILAFCEDVYRASTTSVATDAITMIGLVVTLAHRTTKRLRHLEGVCQPATKSLYAAERAAIEGLREPLLNALLD